MSSHSKIFISKDVCQTSFVPAPSASSQARSIPFYQKKKKIMNGNLKFRAWQRLHHPATPVCSSSVPRSLRLHLGSVNKCGWLGRGRNYICYLSDVLARIGQLSLGKTVVTNSPHPSIANISKGPFFARINRGIGMSVAQNKDQS